MYTSKYFSLSETECRCGCGFDMTDKAKQELDELREAYGAPLIMASGARCGSYNSKVSTTGPNGPHTTGGAADLAVSHADSYRLIGLAIARGFTGIGVQQKGAGRFVHVDKLTNAPGRPRPTVWSY